MKLFDRDTELSILRTYCANNPKTTSLIVQGINEDCFHTAIGSEIYDRINTIATQRGITLSWADLKADIAVSEDARNIIRKFKGKPIKDPKLLKERIGTLQNLRRARVMYSIAETVTNDMIKKDKVDIDKLYSKITDLITEASNMGSVDDWFLNIGSKDKKGFIKELKTVLTTQPMQYIPTGVEAFDKANRGVPRGYTWNIVGPTGWGKSVMANMLAGSMARKGARVAVISLEMSKYENLQRQVSRVSDTEMDLLIDPNERISKEERESIYKIMRKWDRAIEKAGGMLSIVTPNRDVSIKDVMFALEPYEYDCIIIDYVGLLKGADGDDQAKALSRIGRFAKVYAGNTNKVIALCAQLNMDNNRIKYARALEEHASLQWQWSVNDEVKETKIVKVEMPKSRGLNPIDFYLKANFGKMRFEKVDRESVDESKYSSSSEDKAGSEKKKEFKQKKKNSSIYDLE